MYTIRIAAAVLALASSTFATTVEACHGSLDAAGSVACNTYDDTAVFRSGKHPEAVERMVEKLLMARESLPTEQIEDLPVLKPRQHGGHDPKTPVPPKFVRRQHEGHDPKTPMPSKVDRRSPHGPSQTPPLHGPTKAPAPPRPQRPPKAIHKRSAHGPDENDGHFSMPSRDAKKNSAPEVVRRHGPSKSPSPEPAPKIVSGRSAHEPDEEDGHFSY